MSSPFSPSPPPVFFTSSLRNHSNHGNRPHDKVTSHHLPQTQVTSPHYPHQEQVTSPYLPHAQVNSPYLVSQFQMSSPPLCQPQVNTPHHLVSSHSHDAGLDHSDWSGSEPSSDPSYLLNSYSYYYQNQDTSYLDFHLENQNQVSTDLTHHRHKLENPAALPCEPQHTHVSDGVYGHGHSPGPDVDTWGPLEPAVSQLQCSSLASASEVPLGRRSSMEFRSSSAEDFSSNQFFPYSYHDSNATQPFCSPSTPGPSPHYPQTPAISSPGPQMHPRTERQGFQTQTPTQLNRDKTTSCCLHESDSYPASSDPGQHQLSQNVVPNQTKLIHSQSELPNAASSLQSCFPPQGRGQNVSSAAQPPGLPAGLNWGEECGGGRGGDGDSQPDLTWNWGNNCFPPVQPSVSMVMPTSVPVQSRGMSKVCRSGEQRRCTRQSSAPGGAVLYCSLMRPNAAKEEEEMVARGDGVVVDGGEDSGGVVGGNRGHYTPPPMLCPVRAGPGLYCSLTTRRQRRVQTVQLHNSLNGLGDLVSTETAPPSPGTLTTGINKPRINVGPGNQAETPSLQDRKYVLSDSHNALLLWTPWDVLEPPDNQQRVEALLSMAQSSVVPGGGANPEYALHILSESRGDFLLTVEKLLSSPVISNNNLSAAGVGWSPAETRLLVKSLQLHHKDFSSVQRHVQTKSLSQCVEFYYLWKKKLSLSGLRMPATLTDALPEENVRNTVFTNTYSDILLQGKPMFILWEATEERPRLI
ncbi:hypothetical protein PAMP_016727 [Pampus punctatissimus]